MFIIYTQNEYVDNNYILKVIITLFTAQNYKCVPNVFQTILDWQQALLVAYDVAILIGIYMDNISALLSLIVFCCY